MKIKFRWYSKNDKISLKPIAQILGVTIIVRSLNKYTS